jgi:4-amino-4-deoxy-L-arabinose transferase-like glycosyltransferase
VFLAAFAVRSLYAVDQAPAMYSHQQEGTRMAGRYDEAAIAMLEGDGILFPARPDPADTGRLARPPGYALFLAAVYAVLGRSFFLVQLVQNLLGAAAPLLVLKLGERLVGWRVGLVAGWLSALSAHLAYTTNLILADALCPLPLLLALVLLAPGADHRPAGVLSLLGAGASLGAAAWLRPNVLLLGPFLAAALVLAGRGRRRLFDAALVAAASLAVVAPITLRNWIVYREFVPVSINGGITLLQGVADAGGRRFGVRPRDKLVIEEEAAYYGDERLAEWWAAPDGIRRDRERYREAMREIRARPLWYARAMLRRMGDMLNDYRGEPAAVAWRLAADAPAPVEAADAARPPVLSARHALWPGRLARPLRPLVWAAQQAVRFLALPLLALGTLLLLRHDARRAVLLLVVPAYYLLFESFFIYEWRVAVPMRYPACVLIAAGAVALSGGWPRRAPRGPA